MEYYRIAQLTTYTVSPYETMYSIAEKFNIPLQQLLDFNNLTATSPIYPGLVLRIPINSGPTNQSPGNFIHTVAPGDNLWTIAKRYGVSVENIMYMNGLHNTLLQVGAQLRIPMAIMPL
jgi:LysM repeat protein